VTDDPVLREIRQLREDWRDDMGQLRSDIQARVLREVYDTERTAMNARVTGLETKAADSEKERQNSRRWVVTAIISPIVMMIFTLVITVMKP